MNEIEYNVLIDSRVEKDLKQVPPHIVDRFLNSLDHLGEDPFHCRSGMDIKKLKGDEIFRMRLGDYRVLYSIDQDNKTVKITSIAHRSKVFRMFCPFICL
jgi:mRNA interferase RelE/StbE